MVVTDVTAVGSAGRAKRAILGVILAWHVFGRLRTYLWTLSHFGQSRTCYFGADLDWACFLPIQVVFVAGEPLCGVGTPS